MAAQDADRLLQVMVHLSRVLRADGVDDEPLAADLEVEFEARLIVYQRRVIELRALRFGLNVLQLSAVSGERNEEGFYPR